MAGVEDIYRSEFRNRVLSGRPRSLLEVGCGSGTFLRSVKNDLIRIAGLDPDTDALDELTVEGIESFQGVAEHLPFQDREFDVVVFSFTPHHVKDWNAALHEALRVAKLSVEILDVWYDDSIPDQRVAHALDRWCKEIDRRTGMIHGDTLPPGLLLEPVVGSPEVTYDYVCRRVSAAWPIAEAEAMSREYLTRAGNDAALAAGLDQILADARRYGLSEEGCVQMTIEVG